MTSLRPIHSWFLLLVACAGSSRDVAFAQAKVSADLEPNSVWISRLPKQTFTVLERKGTTFRARYEGSQFSRIVSGTVQGTSVSWKAVDVQATKGGPGEDTFGAVQGNSLVLERPQ